MQVTITTTDDPTETIVGTYISETHIYMQVEDEQARRRHVAKNRIAHFSFSEK